MSLLSRLLNRRPSQTVAPTPRSLPYTRLTLAEWCASPERVAYAHELFKAPLFRDLVGMLANVRPPKPLTVDVTSAAISLGQREGYDHILATLLAAATSPPAPPADVPLDYGAANVMALWEGERDDAT